MTKSSGTKKSKSKSARPATKTKKKSSAKNRSPTAKTATNHVDILSPAAMENIYYISHNAVDCLEFRGFGWPRTSRKNSKKGKKRKS
ncbi:small lysine-rich protein 1 [Triplophysa dalaica]|uniref:small lysine-rich protein 1 n=1 Tax=Triplophysa dalaica TaxID=1582913 RepID=UPI0024DF689B|nr:small lysine-rich protein 1 [Triplophysa dalaica]